MRQMLLGRIRASGPHPVYSLFLYCFNLLFIDTVPGLKQCKGKIWLFLMRGVEIWESNAVELVGKQLIKFIWFSSFKN